MSSGGGLEKLCFVIAPIGSAGSDTRKRSDQILKHVIRPAMAGRYRTIRADELPDPGIITSQVIQHVLNDDLVIADLTGQNANVFYELALRHTVRKPVIQLIEANEVVPFDLRGVRTINVDHHDLDSVDQARHDISDAMDWLEANADHIESPVSVAVGIQRLRESTNPVERGNAQILEELASLGRQLTKLRVENIQERVRLEGLYARGSVVNVGVVSDLEESGTQDSDDLSPSYTEEELEAPF